MISPILRNHRSEKLSIDEAYKFVKSLENQIASISYLQVDIDETFRYTGCEKTTEQQKVKTTNSSNHNFKVITTITVRRNYYTGSFMPRYNFIETVTIETQEQKANFKSE